VHWLLDTLSQPAQPPKEELELGVAARVMFVPEEKLPEQVDAQLSPGGVLMTVPDPVPAKSTVKETPPKQITVAVMYPVTIAPCDEMLPSLLLVVTVAETKALPQAFPVAVNNPVELTVAISVVLEAHVA
jgi:hypothetical protein